MHFDCKVKFLGMQENKLQDGTVYYHVSFYDENGGPVELNVMGHRTDVLSLLGSLSFGASLVGHFAIVPKDKLYRLALVGLSPDGK